MSNGYLFYKKLTFHPGFNEPIKLKPESLILKLFSRLVRLFEHVAFNKFNIRAQFSYDVNERIVEVPFVFQNVSLPKGSKILDVGCNESKVSIELASLGYEVTGIDFFPFSGLHPSRKNRICQVIPGERLPNIFIIQSRPKARWSAQAKPIMAKRTHS